MRDNMCLLIFLLVVGLTYLQAAVPQTKRQGMFGLCQGWGAGCSMNYRSQNRGHSKSSTSLPAPSARNARYSVPSYLFTSGSSWNPIGKRSAWYTDIAFLRSPLVSLLNLKKPKECWSGNHSRWKPEFPLALTPDSDILTDICLLCALWIRCRSKRELGLPRKK